MNRRDHQFAAFALLLAIAASDVVAETYCVGTTNTLRNTLTFVRGNGVSDEIRIVAGNYPINSPSSDYVYTGGISGSENLLISGGWNADCTAQVTGAEGTRLSGGGIRPVMQLNWEPGAQGMIVVQRLSIVDGRADNARTGGLAVQLGGAAHVLLDGLIISGNQNADLEAAAGLDVRAGSDTASARIRNVLIHGNNSLGGAGAVRIYSSGLLYASNLTVAYNAGGGHSTRRSGLLLQCLGSCQGALSNTVIHGNTLGTARNERRIEFGEVFELRNNRTSGQQSTAGNFAGLVLDQDLAIADPMFASPTSFLAAPGSPLIDTGINLPPGGVSSFDVSGMPRVIGGTIDIGAFENEIDGGDTLRLSADGIDGLDGLSCTTQRMTHADLDEAGLFGGELSAPLPQARALGLPDGPTATLRIDCGDTS